MDPIYPVTIVLGALVVVEIGVIMNSLRYTRKLLRIKDQHEAELRRAHEKLKSVDKLKTDFMNIAAHELKTPLVPMVGYLHLIDRDKLGREDRESLDIAIRNTKRLQRLVEDILDIAKLESKVMKFNMEEIQTANLARDAAASAAPFAKEKKIALNTKVPSKLPPIVGDAGRLTQVLTNLLNNAIKFTDQGSVTLVARKKGDQIVIEVIDTGIGISRKDQSKLFTKFYQADTSARRKYGGTGLGLAICKEIVKAHKGKIWVKSRLGHGSTFGFSLPIKK
ncbi:MAG: HAMP domain-containing sensor histidine kinase [Hadesarchaea archaeon]|nr:HAMP domain-containing sensor histidine kinase [Hadesarchaea archaeon]